MGDIHGFKGVEDGLERGVEDCEGGALTVESEEGDAGKLKRAVVALSSLVSREVEEDGVESNDFNPWLR